ncbi:MAG TPA: rhodanese-like domain-containing protein [Clostridia bacterium]|nr:rhodanese-like domain-containing protein [Clostridia bacterium]
MRKILRSLILGLGIAGFVFLLHACAAPPLNNESSSAITVPEAELECEPCEPPELEPLPEGYSLGNTQEQASTEVQKGVEELYTRITPEQALEMMNGDDPVLIVDVRTEEEYATGHIPGALLLPNETIGETQPELLPDKSATILVYCRSGNRSRTASIKLLELGYENVYDFGGITSWPYEITTDNAA